MSDVAAPSKTSLLDASCFKPYGEAPHSFYVIQLTSEGEKQVSGAYISDAIVDHLHNEKAAGRAYSHALLQTHGWNTKAQNAVSNPFATFIGGLLNDTNMPSYKEFRPLFVCFTWESLFSPKDENIDATAFDDVQEKLLELNKKEYHDANTDDSASKKGFLGGVANFINCAGDALVQSVAHVANMANFDDHVFERLMPRALKTGEVLGGVMVKLMNASQNTRFSLMANSLGAHVIGGALNVDLPRKLHSVYVVQGAAESSWYNEGGQFSHIAGKVAGPTVCTTSDEDDMLKNVFSTIYGAAVGIKGFPRGVRLAMKSRKELAESPYKWTNGEWHTIDGSVFIDDIQMLAGGHGDFKEDETTMTYWSMIKADVHESLYS